jgi:hypothetical protein
MAAIKMSVEDAEFNYQCALDRAKAAYGLTLENKDPKIWDALFNSYRAALDEYIPAHTTYSLKEEAYDRVVDAAGALLAAKKSSG